MEEITMKKRIGLLGGISYTSTLKYYSLLMEKYHRLKKDYYYPEVIIYSLDFQKFTDFEDRGQLNDYEKYIRSGLAALKRAGAEVIAMTANSPHKVFDKVKNFDEITMISIVESACGKARSKAMKKVLLLGIKFTMQSSFYQEVFENNGIGVITPSDKEQDLINKIIFEELAIGIINPFSKIDLLNIINRYKVDGVILGCTELPLILIESDTTVELIDTIDLHTSEILKAALNN